MNSPVTPSQYSLPSTTWVLHLPISSFHINHGGIIQLNDNPAYSPAYYVLWNETAIIKKSGVKIMGMVGGAAPGSWTEWTLGGDFNSFEHCYRQLHDAIVHFGLQGMDLDVEQQMSLEAIERLVRRLRYDFGHDFVITLAPVATALTEGTNLSGFDYKTLEVELGREISFYIGQFYNGFACDYEKIIEHGFKPARVVAGSLTTERNGGEYVNLDICGFTFTQLIQKYGDFGGVAGWEYFNSSPGGEGQPWKWAQVMTEYLRPNVSLFLKLTKKEALDLTEAWAISVNHTGNVQRCLTPTVDYMAMVDEQDIYQ